MDMTLYLNKDEMKKALESIGVYLDSEIHTITIYLDSKDKSEAANDG